MHVQHMFLSIIPPHLSRQLCSGWIHTREQKGRAERPAQQPLPHKVGTGPGPPAALVHTLDHCLRAVLHLAGHRPCHRVMAPVPVGRTTVTSALLVLEVPTVGQKVPL